MSVLSKGTMFPEEIVSDLISKVRGTSALAVLSNQKPVAFDGEQLFTFNMDSEIDVVAENGKKSHGGMTIEPVNVVPYKVEYGARVSDEFMFADEEHKLNTLKAFNEGFAKKLAKGFDLMAFHGVNPRTGTASTVIGTNNFDTKITQTVVFDATKPDDNIEDALSMISGNEREYTGIALSELFRKAMGSIKVNGVPQYPEFRMGACPATIGLMIAALNNTVSGASSKDRAIIGDFSTMFRWGYAKNLPMEIIPYGDPDNTGVDLKGSNQIYIRSEAYIGWGILDPSSFVRIATE